MAKDTTPPEFIQVQYVGQREAFTDHLYGTELTFRSEQVRTLPARIATKFLRHTDLFKRSNKPMEKEGETLRDNTDTMLEDSDKNKKQREEHEAQIHDMVDRINSMDKTSLTEFANEKFGHKFSQRTKVDDMRKETVSLIHRFGVV